MSDTEPLAWMLVITFGVLALAFGVLAACMAGEKVRADCAEFDNRRLKARLDFAEHELYRIRLALDEGIESWFDSEGNLILRSSHGEPVEGS